ncbi:MAG: ATP-binding protein [Ardenticatenaceae bacterium]|nr:ATP-binding protein [Ardenticatenaceae bacterium]
MNEVWNQTVIQQYIDDLVEESLELEYKAASSLDSSDAKKKEIAKDISSIANSNGGIIIYGVAEYQNKDKKHLPERIDPIDRKQFSRETLEQIINSNIYPRIQGVEIFPIPIDLIPNGVVYVVKIPKSDTAHQNGKDHKYYKRYNFLAVPMEDFEVRDVMNRSKVPRAQVEFLESYSRGFNLHGVSELGPVYNLSVRVLNVGEIIINHFKTEFTFPRLDEISPIWHPAGFHGDVKLGSVNFVPHFTALIQVKLFPQEYLISVISKDVLFPKDSVHLHESFFTLEYQINSQIFGFNLEGIPPIKWKLYADNMAFKSGTKPLSELHR